LSEGESINMTEINKQEFVARLADKGEITKKDAKAALELVIDGIKDVYAENSTLQLTGFGKFESVLVPEKTRVLGFSGETVTTPEHFAHKAKISKSI